MARRSSSMSARLVVRRSATEMRCMVAFSLYTYVSARFSGPLMNDNRARFTLGLLAATAEEEVSRPPVARPPCGGGGAPWHQAGVGTTVRLGCGERRRRAYARKRACKAPGRRIGWLGCSPLNGEEPAVPE